MQEKIEQLSAIFKEKKLKVACAESLSSGHIAAALSYLPGSSAFFYGGIVAYSNQLKIALLGVDKDIILKYGAVSRQCAEAMALGAKHKLGVDVAVSSTGIAGPSGGSLKKPVGTVWIAACCGSHRAGLSGCDAASSPLTGPPGSNDIRQGETLESRKFNFNGDRHEVIQQTVQEALSLLLEIITR